jgi:peptidoglycan/xylan/chitin deacetylase (PgdA/CDA1 family)
LFTTHKWQKKAAKKSCMQPMLSISFDDFPADVIDNAVPILEAEHIKATFYVNGLNLGKDLGLGLNANLVDIIRLQENGHELANHGYAHVNYTRMSAAEMRHDLARNKQFFADNNLEISKSFAYPYGSANLLSKKILTHQATSCRGIVPGVNARHIDLNLLKANALYDSTSAEIRQLLAQYAQQPCWIILYTHDVSAQPSPYGCSTTIFAQTIKLCKELGYNIVTVEQAVSLLWHENKA